MRKITFLIALSLLSFTSYAQWSTSGGNVITNETAIIQSDNGGLALELEANNKDVDFRMGHAPGGYGFFWRYKGTDSGNDNDLELWSENETSSNLLVYNVKQSGNISFGQKVGIGTSTMGNHLLAVDGSIGAREVTVESSGWSDFVFENDYKLPSLEEVEKHIADKGHLIDVPSATDIEKNGIPLGEMDAKLLQKIEELTLYVLELNRQNVRLQEEVKNLKQVNQKLLPLLD